MILANKNQVWYLEYQSLLQQNYGWERKQTYILLVKSSFKNHQHKDPKDVLGIEIPEKVKIIDI